HGKLYT
ncbi:hypothetical protein MK416_09345, partial [Streptococcus oralis]|nr:hypothetical protein [Streptococcus oralis]